MNVLLWLVVGALITFLVSNFMAKRHYVEDDALLSPQIAKAEQDILHCEQIIASTPTNNSYEPIGDVLADLDMPNVKEILGGELQMSVEGILG